MLCSCNNHLNYLSKCKKTHLNSNYTPISIIFFTFYHGIWDKSDPAQGKLFLKLKLYFTLFSNKSQAVFHPRAQQYFSSLKGWNKWNRFDKGSSRSITRWHRGHWICSKGKKKKNHIKTSAMFIIKLLFLEISKRKCKINSCFSFASLPHSCTTCKVTAPKFSF